MVEGVDWVRGYFYEFPMDEESYVGQIARDSTSTSLFNLEDQTAETLLTFPGFLLMVDRLEAT